MLDVMIPPSSSPFEIYRLLHRDVVAGDKHSTKIKENKVGLRHGASLMCQQKVIDDAAEQEINAIIDQAESKDFRPLLYVIPYKLVAKRVQKVPLDKRAHPLSDEYTIANLSRRHFDVIEFPV